MATLPQDIIMTRDSNFNFADCHDANICLFMEQLVTDGLRQLVTGATHMHGLMLDIFISRGISYVI